MNIIKGIQILLAVLFLTTTSITCTDYIAVKDNIEIVQLTAQQKVPILRIHTKGQEYLFLLDSQSPVSFIDSSVVAKKGLEIVSEEPQDLLLITGDVNKRTKCVRIMDNLFYVHNFKTTKASIKWHTGFSIDGIIGNDMIYNNRAGIDLRKIILDKLNNSK